jgi:hypothetical protein
VAPGAVVGDAGSSAASIAAGTVVTGSIIKVFSALTLTVWGRRESTATHGRVFAVAELVQVNVRSAGVRDGRRAVGAASDRVERTGDGASVAGLRGIGGSGGSSRGGGCGDLAIWGSLCQSWSLLSLLGRKLLVNRRALSLVNCRTLLLMNLRLLCLILGGVCRLLLLMSVVHLGLLNCLLILSSAVMLVSRVRRSTGRARGLDVNVLRALVLLSRSCLNLEHLLGSRQSGSRSGSGTNLLHGRGLDNLNGLVMDDRLVHANLSWLLYLMLLRCPLEDGPKSVGSGFRFITQFSQCLQYPSPVVRVGLLVVKPLLVFSYMSLTVNTHVCEDMHKVVARSIVGSHFTLQLVWTDCNCNVLTVLPLLTGVEASEILEIHKLASWLDFLVNYPSLHNCGLLVNHLVLLV